MPSDAAPGFKNQMKEARSQIENRTPGPDQKPGLVFEKIAILRDSMRPSRRDPSMPDDAVAGYLHALDELEAALREA